MPTIIIAIAAFVGVAALVGGVASIVLRSSGNETVEDRLDVLAGNKSPQRVEAEKTLLAGPLDDVPNQIEAAIARMLNVRLMLEQADMAISPVNFLLIVLALLVAGSAIPLVAGLHFVFAPIVGLTLAIIPFGVLVFKRKRRMNKFAQQLPEALELMSRALRAGHSLGAGFQLVGTEVGEPLGPEFHRVFDEQNFGVPLDEAMQTMTDRVPNLDLRFFATAVTLQRQTGGDLAEILDKIGHLVRERFKIYGQIQALTGEGRLSGLVLLALPPFLFAVMFKLNPKYISLLFTDPMGKKLLAVVITLQIVGALVIKKIVNIKV
jgi:tight adherence protein B